MTRSPDKIRAEIAKLKPLSELPRNPADAAWTMFALCNQVKVAALEWVLRDDEVYTDVPVAEVYTRNSQGHQVRYNRDPSASYDAECQSCGAFNDDLMLPCPRAEAKS